MQGLTPLPAKSSPNNESTKGTVMADSKSTAKKPAAEKKATSSAKKATSSVKVTATKIKPASKSADKAAPKKAATAKTDKPNKISAEERYRMTEVAAYFLAERNKFAGQPVDYWTAAEEQVSKMLKK